jgi:hypothetical protein
LAFAGAFVCGGDAALAQAPRAPVKLDRSKLTTTFADEFDGPLSLWNPKTRQGRWKTNYFFGDPFGPSGRVADDVVVVDPAYCGLNPFIMGGGMVRLELSRTASADPRLGGKTMTGGLLTTERSFVQTYGYFECRFASPSIPGCWPAFWLFSAPVDDLTGAQWDNGLGYGRQWTGGLSNEIDVVEILTNDTKQTYHTAHVRAAWKDGKPGTGYDPAFRPEETGPQIVASDGTDAMHDYGVLWTADKIVWYVDDSEVFSAPNPGIHDPMYVIVSMGNGGWNGNALPLAFTNAHMVVDFVRIFSVTA